MLDAQKAELDARFEAVCRLARLRLETARAEGVHADAYGLIQRNFDAMRRSLDEGRISIHFAKGMGFGGTMALSEWDLKDPEMFDAICAAEDYFRTGS